MDPRSLLPDAESTLKAASYPITREQIVAHATLSAFAHHWPSATSSELKQLLKQTQFIREEEPNRWMTQRRIALAKWIQVNT